ncbi:MAG: PAS domain S-box protein [Phycisphaerae bacterium]|jgi:PAS domain S-box-containing protein
MSDARKTRAQLFEELRALRERLAAAAEVRAHRAAAPGRPLEPADWPRLVPLAVQQSNKGIAITEPDGRLLFVNAAFAAGHGYTAEALVGQPLSSVYPAPETAAAAEHLRFVRETGAFGGPVQHARHDGTTFSAYMHGTLIREESGQPLAVFIAMSDVPALQQAEEALRRNERFLQDIFEGIQDGLCVLDRDLAVLRVNGWMERRYAGRMPLVGRKCYEVFLQRDTRCPDCPCLAALESGQVQTAILPSSRATGVTGWVELSAFPLQDAAGRPFGIIQHVKDVTDRERAQAALHDSEQRLRSLFDGLPVGLYRATPAGQILEANPAMAAMFGYDDRTELMAQNVESLYVDSDERARALRELGQGDGPYTAEARMRRRDGRIIWVSDCARVVRDDAGRVLYCEGALEDISLRKETELELARYRGHLEELVHSRTEELTRAKERLEAELAERSRADAALRDQEQQHRQLFQNAQIGIFRSKLDGSRLLAANQKMAELIERPLAEILALPATAHWADLRDRADMLRRLSREGVVTNFESRLVTGGGKQKTCLFSASLYADRGYLEGTVLDISDRKQADDLLRMQRDLGVALSAANSLQEAFTHWLDTAMRIEGIDAGSVHAVDEQRRHLTMVVHRNLTPHFAALAQQLDLTMPPARAVLDGQPLYWRVGTFGYLDDHARRDGFRIAAAFPVPYAGDVVAVLVVVSRSLDRIPESACQALESMAVRLGGLVAHFRAREALRESEELFRTIVTSSMDAMLAIDQNGNISIFNPAAERMFGCREAEVLHQPLDWLMPAEQRARHGDYVRRYFTTGDPQNAIGRTAELTIMDRSGREFPIEVSLSAGQRSGEPFVLAVIRDITERKRAEAERARLQEQLYEAKRMETVGQVAVGIAHDFGNLLAVARNGVRQLQSHPAATELRAGLETVAQAVDEASSSIQSLLLFSHKLPVERVPLKLCRLVEESAPMLRHLLPDDVDLCVSVHEGGGCLINGDPGQLQQVLMNLALNARDVLLDGGVLNIDVQTLGDDASPETPRAVCLTVRDSGPGIPPEVQPRIFEPFFTTKSAGRGTGLGLATVRSIVRDHGGHIAVASTPGQGATFTIVLPTIAATPSEVIPIPDGRGRLVLLTEPNRHARRLMLSTLRSWNYDVRTPASADELRETYTQVQPPSALLILSVDTPADPSLACLEEIRAAGGPPVILMCGQPDTDLAAHLDERTLLLHKPFQMSELGRTLGRLLERPRPEGQTADEPDQDPDR